jgi:alcohol dehydrogenase, propanol-preferring
LRWLESACGPSCPNHAEGGHGNWVSFSVGASEQIGKQPSHVAHLKQGEINPMSATYRAVEVTKPGQLSLTRKPVREPGAGEVRIRVEACGVCHSDAGTVDGLFPIAWPRVPGHEAVGRIDALGSGVLGWDVGQRVGVGFLAGSCSYCDFCRGGDLVNCKNQGFTGIHQDGGYAEVMIAKASGLVSIPDMLSSAQAAPLLCAGITTFSALRNAPAKAGDVVAVMGIGGLGHLGVQYARHMGFEVVAIARGADKAALAKELGAHHYIDSGAVDPAAKLQELGGARVILVTASSGKAVSETFKGLRVNGVSVVVGVGPEPIEVSGLDLIFGSRKLEGALTGDPATGDETLRFSALSGISAMIETMPLERASEAYAKMMAGKARFRMVLTMD